MLTGGFTVILLFLFSISYFFSPLAISFHRELFLFIVIVMHQSYCINLDKIFKCCFKYINGYVMRQKNRTFLISQNETLGI